MPKRLSATEKWDDPWFRKLKPEYKALWLFLVDKCDHAGIWKLDADAWKYYIGVPFTPEAVLQAFNNGKERVKQVGDKWIVTGFIEFQYGILNPEHRVHKSVIERLSKASKKGIKTLNKPLPNSMHTDKEIEKEKDKDKDKDKDNTHFDLLWSRYPRKLGLTSARKYYNSSVKTEQDKSLIETALNKYLKYIDGKEIQYVKHASTWFNSWREWVEYEEINPVDEIEKIMKANREGTYVATTQ